MASFVGELAQNAKGLIQRITLDWTCHSTQSTTNTFVFLVLPLFLFEEKARRLPSGENMGNESNAESKDTCSNPVPSVLIMKILNGNPPV